MSVNFEKCMHIAFTRKRNPIRYNYNIDKITLQIVDKIKDTGVLVSLNLSFDIHIETICTICII